MKNNLYRDIPVPYFLWYYCYSTVLSGNIKQELEPEPKYGTKVEPEPKIINFGSATLIYCIMATFVVTTQ